MIVCNHDGTIIHLESGEALDLTVRPSDPEIEQVINPNDIKPLNWSTRQGR